MQSDAPAAVEWTVSGSAVSNEFAGTPGDVVVVSQDPAATLALWLPGQLKDGWEQAENSKEQVEGSRKQTNDLLEVQNTVQKRESGNTRTNKMRGFPVKIWLAKSGFFGENSAAEASPPLGQPSQEENMANLGALGQRQDGPVIRSKLVFSKRKDGSQTLSYEEEVVRKDEGDGSSDCGMNNRGRRGLRSMFLDLIRYICRYVVEADLAE
ncbi:unnamed protein product [Tetraodon nigroviridis]|uniref:(spotted green pufferfish) hypothetical protein n=1 Tax=Tetraodon nigroviridis TaxID=99883 RepID=Q4RNX7_TETNG|nr:unnamed protein product [Tetraodon nigroviridis]